MELLNQQRIISEACRGTLYIQCPFRTNLQCPWQGKKDLQAPLCDMDPTSP